MDSRKSPLKRETLPNAISSPGRACERCKKRRAVAKCLLEHEFEEDGTVHVVQDEYWYCEDCAETIDEKFGIDAVLRGDSDVLD